MATTLEISFFNSFLIKKVSNASNESVFPNGWPYNATYPLEVAGGGTLTFPGTAQTTVDTHDVNWFVEETRIRGGYNNTQVDLGVRAYLVEEDTEQQHRSNSLIYSGIYNSRTGINNTNQFSVGKDITKSLDPANGSIQKLFSENTNLTIFQESKVSSALIDKDAIYTAEGSPVQTSSNVVIGQVQAYLGEYGISKNPESFAYYGYQKYFTDRDRGVVLRLSRDGITEISRYGMIDYFRDNLKLINKNNVWTINTDLTTESNPSDDTQILVSGADLNTALIGMEVVVDGNTVALIEDISVTSLTSGVVTANTRLNISAGDIVTFQSNAPSKIISAYDIHNKNYLISLQQTPQYQDTTVGGPENYSTLAFDEAVKGWVSFYSYKPTQALSVVSDFWSIQYANIWKHYSNSVSVSSFYGISTSSNVVFLFNDNPSISKVFQTVNYEGDSGWQVDYFISDPTGYDFSTNAWESFNDSTKNVQSYYEGEYIDAGITYYSGFNRKENKYYANLVNNSSAQPGEVVFGNSVSGIKGRYATAKFSVDSSTNPGGIKELWSVGTKVNYTR